MVNQSFVISNINAVKDNFSINAKGSRISATIGNKMIYQFDSLLKEGESVNLSNFYVVKNNAPYKVANYPFKINFYKKTKVKAIQSVFSSKYGLSFLPFTEFVEDNVTEDQIIDLIGHVAAVGDVVHGERKCKKNRRMVVELTSKLYAGLKLKCTLWDAFIDDFKTIMESSSDHIKVCDFQFGSVRQVSNLTSESSQALEEKSFCHGTKYVNLEQLMDVIECNCKAAPNEDESSSKNAEKRKIHNTYKYETYGPDIVDVIPKFRVQLGLVMITCASFWSLTKMCSTLLIKVDVSRYNLINNYVVYTVGLITSSEMHIKSFIKLYVDEMAEVKDVNKDGYDTNVDNEEPILETPMLETSTSPKFLLDFVKSRERFRSFLGFNQRLTKSRER
ncbi:replication protein A 70 kDa DNA-binding subunit B [Tanacetum coccineum]